MPTTRSLISPAPVPAPAALQAAGDDADDNKHEKILRLTDLAYAPVRRASPETAIAQTALDGA